MQLTIHIPDDLLESVKDKLPPPEVGWVGSYRWRRDSQILNEPE